LVGGLYGGLQSIQLREGDPLLDCTDGHTSGKVFKE